ncbi:DUF2314 domain-containing protein [Motilimonas eburnea]|uniref:DUF2314 domain-containing protein n=1 Tax=Motilimonas eburnea TaxID=1737488 RepID=UPI001E417D85|nr:DUF2314 domain-containing protein [Motilimonas eburnea]MCE2572987.1 DUF2314 domain-containing protein [Motilimonas eburnea]
MSTVSAEVPKEPKFRTVNSNDLTVQKAHSMAASSMPQFIELVRARGESTFMVKLRFRDPELSEKLGEDQLLYLWLTDVYYHEEENFLSGVFFEVPDSLSQWHQVGERLGFDAEDVFDWMVNTNGHVQGAYTIRVTRNSLAGEQAKAEYDEYIGISSYEPISE